MISMRLNPRTVRFARLWMLNFAKLGAIMLLALTVGSTIGYLIILASNAYGFKFVLGGMALAWGLAVVGCISGAIADSQLIDMEHKEDLVMRKLKDDRH